MESLIAEGQGHLFASWPSPGQRDDDKRRLLVQLRHLDASYAGGLVGYVRNARRLLADSKQGVNPFEGCVPSVPEGERLDFGSQAFREYERKGAPRRQPGPGRAPQCMQRVGQPCHSPRPVDRARCAGVEAAADAAFVLVAGGLGERLGYTGIKLALPSESASGACFLQLYVESILALQAKAQASRPGRVLPLAIMTSDDTHARTEALLAAHANFGAAPGQVRLLKQEKVACLSDNQARLALLGSDPFQVQTKPHGHGDVHMLLHSSGLAAEWAAAGLAWVCFFQDTNGQVFRALPAALGVSAAAGYDVNSLAVPRRAREAIGALTRLTCPAAEPGAAARTVTINVEYNQLDPLLRATVAPEGDTDDPATGFSPFPGNINQLVLSLTTYVAELRRHGGVIAEFVNPKYADAGRETFKSSTRLECMMQDFPKSLPEGAKVGFTVINQVG